MPSFAWLNDCTIITLQYCSWFEQEPEELFKSVQSCLDKVGGALGSHSISRLKGIGVTNQRETTILWDRTTGKCLYNAIVWCDGRGSEIVQRIIGNKTKDELRVS